MGATVAIIGYGHVGEAMNEIFPDSIKYDKYKGSRQQDSHEVLMMIIDLLHECIVD